MLAFAQRPSTDAYACDGFDIHDQAEDDYQDELVAGERICVPGNFSGNARLRASASITIAILGGWALLNSEAVFHKMESAARSVAAIATPEPAQTQAAFAPAIAPPATEPAPFLPDLESTEIAVAPGTPTQFDTETSSASQDQAANDDVSTSTANSRLDAGTTNPNRARAAAVGLNPELSNALLTRLTPTDYRNAAVAIRTALEKIPDTGTYIWPQKRSAKLARFEVRFVAGAAPDCRRYVVTITKDRWATTALPMEKCGTRPPDHKTARREL